MKYIGGIFLLLMVTGSYAEELKLCDYLQTNLKYSKIKGLKENLQKEKQKYFCFLALHGDHRAQKKVAMNYFESGDYVEAYGWISLSNSVSKRASKERLLIEINQKLQSSGQLLKAKSFYNTLNLNIGTGITIDDSGRQTYNKNNTSTGTKMRDVKPIGRSKNNE